MARTSTTSSFSPARAEEVNFDIVWFIDGLDEPIEKTSFTAPLNSVEWSIKHNHTVVRTDDCDFVYYLERIGKVLRYDGDIVPEALRSCLLG